MKWRIADFFVIALVIIVAFAIWLYPVMSTHGGKALIKQGESVQTVSLINNNSEIQLNGAIVKIRDGNVSIVQSNCTDKVCVNTGEISKKGESIVCVPNGIVITIEGEREIDAVAN